MDDDIPDEHEPSAYVNALNRMQEPNVKTLLSSRDEIEMIGRYPDPSSRRQESFMVEPNVGALTLEGCSEAQSQWLLNGVSELLAAGGGHLLQPLFANLAPEGDDYGGIALPDTPAMFEAAMTPRQLEPPRGVEQPRGISIGRNLLDPQDFCPGFDRRADDLIAWSRSRSAPGSKRTGIEVMPHQRHMVQHRKGARSAGNTPRTPRPPRTPLTARLQGLPPPDMHYVMQGAVQKVVSADREEEQGLLGEMENQMGSLGAQLRHGPPFSGQSSKEIARLANRSLSPNSLSAELQRTGAPRSPRSQGSARTGSPKSSGRSRSPNATPGRKRPEKDIYYGSPKRFANTWAQDAQAAKKITGVSPGRLVQLRLPGRKRREGAPPVKDTRAHNLRKQATS